LVDILFFIIIQYKKKQTPILDNISPSSSLPGLFTTKVK